MVYGSSALMGPVQRRFGAGIGSTANPTFETPDFVSQAREIQLALRLSLVKAGELRIGVLKTAIFRVSSPLRCYDAC